MMPMFMDAFFLDVRFEGGILRWRVSFVNQVPMSNHHTSNASRMRPDAFLVACPSRALLARLGEKWTLLALVAMVDEPQYFGELRRRLQGVSQKMLTQTLRALERDGLVRRRVVDARPVRVEYSLTPLGSEFAERASALKVWAEKNLRPVARQQTAFDQKALQR
jgi:DNA-binding HxlR family transcriptional regulator